MRVKVGNYYTFTPSAKTEGATGRPLLPGRVRVVRKLGPDEAGREVGPMYEVTHHASGHTWHVFKDELAEA